MPRARLHRDGCHVADNQRDEPEPVVAERIHRFCDGIPHRPEPIAAVEDEGYRQCLTRLHLSCVAGDYRITDYSGEVFQVRYWLFCCIHETT